MLHVAPELPLAVGAGSTWTQPTFKKVYPGHSLTLGGHEEFREDHGSLAQALLAGPTCFMWDTANCLGFFVFIVRWVTPKGRSGIPEE